jgi:hypothetical protein
MPHKSIAIKISNLLGNALPELIKAIVEINNGKQHFAAIMFFDEPGRCLLQLTSISIKEIQLAFYSHENIFVPKNIAGKTKKGLIEVIENDIQYFTHIATWQCSKKELTDAVIIAMDNLLLQTPTKKYREEWGSLFPTKWYNLLKMKQ